MTLRVTAAGGAVTVRGDAVRDAERILGRLVSDGVPAALMARNATLWGPDAAGRAAERLGWVDLPETSLRLLPGLAELAVRLAGLDRIVLVGMGAAASAAGVIAAAHDAPLTTLDTIDPHHVRRVLAPGALGRTVLVVSSRTGRTIETDCLWRVAEGAFRAAGIDPAERIVVVTAPGSPFEATAKEAGHPVVLTDPDVAGHYGALDAAGLAPSALAGADPRRLLAEAAALRDELRLPYDNPGLALGAALGGAAMAGRNKLVLADRGRAGLGGWVEGLIATSTGKDGRGLLPVLVEDTSAPGFGFADDVRRVVLGEPPDDAGLTVSGPPGVQFLLWEYATAVAARIIGVDPFDEPGVRESADTTAGLLRGSEYGDAPILIAGEPTFADDAVEVHGDDEVLGGIDDLSDALDALIAAVPARGHLAVTAFLDPAGDAAAAALRPLLARRAAARNAPVTFGWAPSVLHTTGQYHKEGPPTGVYLQITGAVTDDVPVPGRPYGLGAVQLAQAFGDLRALRARRRPVMRLHLRDRAAGLARLTAVLSA